MHLSTLTKDLRLTAIGITSAELLPDELDHLTTWLATGYNGEMAWMAKDPERRADPTRIMPDCKTVIVAAMKYNEMPTRRNSKFEIRNPKQIRNQKSEIRNQKTSALAHQSASAPIYLQHEDYHKIMTAKLTTLANSIKQEYPSAQCKCYVDTGPVLEKAWGVRAGLGFIGKNTLLISPEHGSQMALGVVLTDTEQLVTNRSLLTANRCLCNSCTACMEACPTKALVAPYILDARRCISYKFFIDKKKGGCDICQDVCPYNSL